MYRETHSRIGVHSRIRGGRKGRQEIVVARCCFLASRADDTEYWSIVFQSHHRLNPCAMRIYVAVIVEDSQETQETEGRHRL